MGIILSRFFLAAAVFQIAVAVAMHVGAVVPARFHKHSAFGQMCLGAALMFLAQAFGAPQPGPALWVAVGLAPVLVVVGVRLEVQAHRAIRAAAATSRYRHKRDSIQPSGGPA